MNGGGNDILNHDDGHDPVDGSAVDWQTDARGKRSPQPVMKAMNTTGRSRLSSVSWSLPLSLPLLFPSRLLLTLRASILALLASIIFYFFLLLVVVVCVFFLFLFFFFSFVVVCLSLCSCSLLCVSGVSGLNGFVCLRVRAIGGSDLPVLRALGRLSSVGLATKVSAFPSFLACSQHVCARLYTCPTATPTATTRPTKDNDAMMGSGVFAVAVAICPHQPFVSHLLHVTSRFRQMDDPGPSVWMDRQEAISGNFSERKMTKEAVRHQTRSWIGRGSWSATTSLRQCGHWRQQQQQHFCSSEEAAAAADPPVATTTAGKWSKTATTTMTMATALSLCTPPVSTSTSLSVFVSFFVS